MRALAVIVTLAAWTCCVHATDHDLLARAIRLLHISNQSPLYNLVECSNNLGFTKCISALSSWRATSALQSLESGRAAQINIVRDVKQFPWEQYGNTTEDQLYDRLCGDTVRLLKYRSLELSLPGYGLELDATPNGTLHVDLIKNDESTQATGRGAMKKLMKQFYDIVPLLILPGLLMSAVLPFILPGLKMMTVLVGMINNMALSGAVFTLLRNNAFNDHYEKKIIYVNDGYKNENFFKDSFKDTFKSSFKDIPFRDIPLDNVELQFSPSEMHSVMAADSSGDNVFFDSIKPSDEQWLKDYYGAQDMSALPLKTRRSHDVGTNEQQKQPQQQQIQEQQFQQQQFPQQQFPEQQFPEQQFQQQNWDPVSNVALNYPQMADGVSQSQ